MAFAGVQERVAPPADQAMWYVTVFGVKADAKFQQLQSWFNSDAGLKNLRNQCHYNEYTTDQIRFKRYKDGLPGLPCVRVQNEKGRVISEYWADNIPNTSDALYRGIRSALQNKAQGCLFGKRRRKSCPNRQPPTPPSTPPPTPPVGPPAGPPVLPPEPKAPGFPWLLALLSTLTGAGVGIYHGYQKERMDASAPGVAKL